MHAVYAVMRCPSLRLVLFTDIKHFAKKYDERNSLSIHTTFSMIAPEAFLGETKMW